MKPYLEESNSEKRQRVMIRIYDGKQSPPKLRNEFHDYEENLGLTTELFLELEGRHGDASEIYFEVFSKDGDKLLYRYRNGTVYDKTEK